MKLSRNLKYSLCVATSIFFCAGLATSKPLFDFALAFGGASASSSSGSGSGSGSSSSSTASSSSGDGGSSSTSTGAGDSSSEGSAAGDGGEDGGIILSTPSPSEADVAAAESFNSSLSALMANISLPFTDQGAGFVSLTNSFFGIRSDVPPSICLFPQVNNVYSLLTPDTSFISNAIAVGILGTKSESSVKNSLASKEAETPALIGDPVFITAGRFYINDYDASFNWGVNTFSLTRSLTSGNNTLGSYGSQWFCSLDTRIIRGENISETYDMESKLKDLKRKVSEKSNEVSKLYYSFQSDAKKRISKCYDEIENQNDKIKKLRNKTSENAALNKFSKYGFEDEVKSIRGDALIFVEDTGNCFVLSKNYSNGRYVCKDDSSKNKFYITDSGDGGFEVHYLSGVVKKYSVYGLPEFYTDRFGSKIEFSYDAENKISNVKHNGINILDFTRNGNGFLTCVNNNLFSKKINYIYKDNLLVEFKDDCGDVYSFEYNERGDIKKVIKPDGNFTEIFYGENSTESGELTKVISVKNEEGWIETFDGDFKNGYLTYTDPNGNTSEYFFEKGNRITKEIHSDGTFVFRTYNSKNLITVEETNIGKKRFTYDSFGNLIKVLYNDKSYESWTYLQPYNLISSYTNRDGIVTYYTYDAKGNCTKESRGNKCVNAYTYNDWGGVVRIEGLDENNYDYDSLTYNVTKDKTGSYKYDSFGNLTCYENNEGKKWNWKYNDSGKTIELETPVNLLIRFELNNRKDVARKIESDSISGFTKISEYDYGKSHNVLSVKQGFGITESEAVASLKLVRSFEYDCVGNISASYNWNYGHAAKNDASGVCSKYSYSLKGDVLSAERYFVDFEKNIIGEKTFVTYEYYYKDGCKVVSEYHGPKLFSTKYFDEHGALIKEVDGEGRYVQYKYNGNGKVTETVNIYGGIVKYNYDDVSGNVSSVITGSVHNYDFTYNADGKVLSSVKNKNLVTDYEYDESNGKFCVVEKTKRGTNKTVSDSLGRIIEQTSVDFGSGKKVTKKVSYDDKTGISTISVGNNSASYKTDSKGNILCDLKSGSTYTYDKDGNLVLEKDGEREVYYEYNVFGKISYIKSGAQEINFFYDANGNLVKETDAQGIVWQGAYDCNGMLCYESGRCLPKREYVYNDSLLLEKTYEEDDLIQQISYSADLRKITITDALGSSRVLEYDLYGRIVLETNSLGKKKTYEYDASGDTTYVKDFNGNRFSMLVSEEEGKKSVLFEDNSYMNFDYDMTGVLKHAENNSSVCDFSYDDANNMTSSYNGVKKIDYSYGSTGLLENLRIDSKNVSYSYAANGKLTSVKNDLNSIIYDYNSEGLNKSSVSKNGAFSENEYDAAGRPVLTVRKDRNGTVIFAQILCYDQNGRISCSIDKDGKFSLYEYDKHGRLSCSSLPYSNELEESARTEFEECGATVSSKQNAIEKSIPFGYLKEVRPLCTKVGINVFEKQDMWITFYEYDLNGNRISKRNNAGTLCYSYNSENRLKKISTDGISSGIEFSYDANGNLISKKSLYKTYTYSYTADNRQKECRITDFKKDTCYVEKYSYDAFGRRINVKDSFGNSINFVYKGTSFEKVCEYRSYAYVENPDQKDASAVRFMDIDSLAVSGSAKRGEENPLASAPQARYFSYANGKPVMQDNTYGSGYEFVLDSRGSVCSFVNQDGFEACFVRYDSDGNPYFFEEGTSFSRVLDARDAVSKGYALAYLGKQYNFSTQTYDYGFRDYSPEIACFTTSDPVKNGMNWYSYCAGDPINFVDLWGLATAARRFTQHEVGNLMKGLVDDKFGDTACGTTCTLNSVSENYTILTGRQMTDQMAIQAISNAISNGAIRSDNAYVRSWAAAANAMWSATKLPGKFSYNQVDPQFKIYSLFRGWYDKEMTDMRTHFVYAEGNNGEFFDVYDGAIDEVYNGTNKRYDNMLQPGRNIRGFDFSKNS